MSWVAVAVVGGAVIGGVVQSNAANSAASTQADAARGANETQLAMYNTTRADQAPWRAAGANALGQLQENKFLDNFQGDPGYQFRMQQGANAINSSAAARGMANSGRTMKELTRYGQDYASNEYNNAYNRQYLRLTSLAGLGQASTNATSNAGMNTANQIANNTMGAGNAMAAGQVGSANAFSNSLNQGTNAWMQYQMMNRMNSSGGASTGVSGGYGSAGGTYNGSGNMA